MCNDKTDLIVLRKSNTSWFLILFQDLLSCLNFLKFCSFKRLLKVTFLVIYKRNEVTKWFYVLNLNYTSS